MSDCLNILDATNKALCQARARISELESEVESLAAADAPISAIDCTLVTDASERAICEAGARIAGLEGKVEKLSDTVDKLTGGTVGQITTLAPSWLVYGGLFIALLLACFIAFVFVRGVIKNDLKLTKATISQDGYSITLEEATEKVNGLLADIQGHIVDDAARARERLNRLAAATQGGNVAQFLIDDKPAPDPVFNKPPKPSPAMSGLHILWVTDDDDVLLFEKKVLTKMGNIIETEKTNEAALKRLRSKERFDLVLSDIYRKDENAYAGLHLFRVLKDGVQSSASYGNVETIVLGEKLRMGIYTKQSRVRQFEQNFEDTPNALITSDFMHLRSRVQWLQERKKQQEAAAEKERADASKSKEEKAVAALAEAQAKEDEAARKRRKEAEEDFNI